MRTVQWDTGSTGATRAKGPNNSSRLGGPGEWGEWGQRSSSARYLPMDATPLLNLNILRVSGGKKQRHSTQKKQQMQRQQSLETTLLALRSYRESSTWLKLRMLGKWEELKLQR